MGSAPKRDARRIIGTLILQAVLLSIFGLLFALASFHPEDKPGFRPIPRAPYTPALNPIALAELGIPPDTAGTDRTALATLAKDDRIQLVAVKAQVVEMIRGGQVVRSIPTENPPADLDQLAAIIADRLWLERQETGRFVINSGLVIYGGVHFTFGGPAVTDISLTDKFSVFLGVVGGSVTFDKVRVVAADNEVSERHRYRPFVIATKGARMDIRGSEFSGLGWDWRGSYGVSWMQDTTGEAVDSVFEKSFIGVYTTNAFDIAFRRCVFRDNYLYGLDPHTYSRNLTVDEVTAERNGAHGIIFSDHVTDSTITNSVARDNGENGIMMDKRSTRNLIENNTVTGNRGDGLVTSDSPGNLFVNNTVEANRVGVRVAPPDPDGTGFRANRISRNGSAAEDITLPKGNVVRSNGGNWNHTVLGRIWPTALAVLGLIGLAHFVQTIRRWRRISRAPARSRS